ncbi:MAG: AMP-binding protein [Actinobacteria bacterium]|nr:AMP-binding protein [Actinomycetota bacterium]
MLRDVVPEAARRFGDTAALVDGDGVPLSYLELHLRSDEVAAGLAGKGLGPGSVLGLRLPACAEYVVAYVAAAKAGLVTAGVNPRLTAAEQAKLLDVAGPDLVLDDRGAVDELRIPDGVAPELADDPDRPVAIVFTSGTTGTPKGAVFDGRRIAAITQLDVGEEWGGGGRMIASTSLAHIGFMTKLAWYLRRGTTTYMLHRWRAADAMRLVNDVGITSVGGMPTQLAMMLQVPDFDSYDVSSVATIVLGGGPASPALVAEGAKRFGAPVSVRFSSTETGGCGTGTAFDDPPSSEVGVGLPRGPIRITIVDADLRPLPTGEVGEICVHSPTTTRGYWRDEAATAALFTADGSVRTGDLGRLDSQGRLHLAGRSKEMYIRGGYNVFPAEVEAVLADHPAVAEVAIAPKHDDVMGELGVAFVVARPGAPAPSLNDLRTFAAETVSSYKLPDEVRVVDALPLTPMDKLDRRTLGEWAVGSAP